MSLGPSLRRSRRESMRRGAGSRREAGRSLHLADRAVAVLLGEEALADAERLRRDLEELVVGEKLDRVVQRELANPVELHRDIRRAAPHVGEVLLADHVYLEVALADVLSHDHALVDLDAGVEKELPPILRRVQTERGRGAVLPRDLDLELLVRLLGLAVDLLEDHLGPRHLELVAFAAHRLDEDREMELAAAAHDERVRGVGVRDTERDVALELRIEPLAELAACHELPLTPGERAVVDAEAHAKRRLLDADPRPGS